MEQGILEVANLRAAKVADAAFHEFVSIAGKRVLRSVKKGDVAEFVGSFGANYKSAFNDRLDDRDVQLYNNAVQERHRVAHQRHESTIGFGELGSVISAARKILDSITNVLLK